MYSASGGKKVMKVDNKESKVPFTFAICHFAHNDNDSESNLTNMAQFCCLVQQRFHRKACHNGSVLSEHFQQFIHERK